MVGPPAGRSLGRGREAPPNPIAGPWTDRGVDLGQAGAMTPDASDQPASWGTEDLKPTRSRWWLLLAVLVVVALAGGGYVAVKAAFKSTSRDWPQSLAGRAAGLGEVNVPASKVDPTAKPGIYIWSDFDGWHLWVVHGDGVGAVTGSVTSDKDIAKATAAIKGAGRVTRDGKTISISFPADPKLSGVDFDTDFYARHLTFALEGPDGTIPANLVHLGNSRMATEVPVKVDKVQSDDAKNQ